MITLVVTGGVAMGKSSFAGRFCREAGSCSGRIAFFDCDLCVRELLTEPEITARIAGSFGNSVLTTGGHIDRPRLRERVFNSAEQRAELENILHPVVRKRCEQERSRALESNTVDIFLVDVPLFYESGFDLHHDLVVVVACSSEFQMQRLLARQGITETVAKQIVAAQLPIARKMARSDVVLWNDGSLPEFENQIDAFSRWLKKKKLSTKPACPEAN